MELDVDIFFPLTFSLNSATATWLYITVLLSSRSRYNKFNYSP